VLAARAGGVDAIDGPAFNLTQSTDTLAKDCRRAAAMGFDGKWAIHPRQIDAINAAFTPGAAAVAKARGLGVQAKADRRAADREAQRAGAVRCGAGTGRWPVCACGCPNGRRPRCASSPG
jgi:citrate lyase beta subunit